MALTIFVIYFGALLIIGPLAARKMKKKDSSDYILAGRSVPSWLVTGGVIATLINSATLLGYGGSGYSLGITAYFASMGFVASLIWMGYYYIPKLRRMNVFTVPEIFSRMFGRGHKIVAIILVMARDMGVTAGAAIGMAVVLSSVFDITTDVALLITVFITLFFTVTGGMWAVMITDTIQAVMLVLGTTILIPLAISYIGGWDAVINAIPDTHSNIFSAGSSQIIGWILLGTLTSIGYQTLIQRGLSAESDKAAKDGFKNAGIIAIIWYMVPFFIGVLALIIFPNITPDTAFLRLTELFGALGSILFAVVVVSSCISTLSSTVLTTASNISHDIYKDWLFPNATEKSTVLVSRISVVVVAIVGALIARALPFILELLLTGGRIMASSLAPVLLILIFWKKARRAYYSSIIAMIAGSLTTVTMIIVGNQLGGGEGSVVFVWAIDPVLIGMPISILIMLIGTLIETRNLNMEPVNIKNKPISEN